MVLKISTLISFLLISGLSLGQQMEIIRPQPGEIIGSRPEYQIHFTGFNLDATMEYTTDNGITWHKISRYYASGGGNSWYLSWLVPQVNSRLCKIKITDQNDSTKFVVMDSTFTIYKVRADELSINEIKYNFYNDGSSAYQDDYPYSALLWPGGPEAKNEAVFANGLLIGGLVNGDVRFHGSYFWSDLTPGIMINGGIVDNPGDSLYKIWKIRKNLSEVENDSLRAVYQYNYDNWPAEIGAPYVDENGNGTYEKGIDKPEIFGDETIWFVCNDGDSSRGLAIMSNPSIGLEIQCTIYGFKNDHVLKDAIFKKYRIINKGNNTVEKTYFSYWADFDLGDASDDYVGCDSTLNLGIGYNGKDVDAVYGVPPAIGFELLQGPIISSGTSDSALYDSKWISGYKNLQMTSFGPGFKHWSEWIEDFGSVEEAYNNMRGLGTNTGQLLVDPNTGSKTLFAVSGDPAAGIGWFEGRGWPHGPGPADRRLQINTGPFTMAPGDTQEVVYAIVLAQEYSRLSSYLKLKEKVRQIVDFYYREIPKPDNNLSLPQDITLKQNYPNPFNSTTLIEYKIPAACNVEFNVYDILGRVVYSEPETNKSAGIYKIHFDSNRFASGMYVYRLRAGRMVISKKMIVLK